MQQKSPLGNNIYDQILQNQSKSGKIKLTPPVDSYTIILLVLILDITQTT